MTHCRQVDPLELRTRDSEHLILHGAIRPPLRVDRLADAPQEQIELLESLAHQLDEPFVPGATVSGIRDTQVPVTCPRSLVQSL